MDRKIEALLFVSGDEGLNLEQLTTLLETSSSKVKDAIEVLNQRLKSSALTVKKQNGFYVLVTQQQFASLLSHYAKQELNQRLTKPALEVLAVIAYRQPITRLEIDEIRGVQSSVKAIQKLLSYQLIEEVGRKEQPGRPKLYGTTPYFLSYFQIESLEALPPLNIEEEQETEEALFTQLLNFD